MPTEIHRTDVLRLRSDGARLAVLATSTFGTPRPIVADRAIIGFRPDALTAALASEG